MHSIARSSIDRLSRPKTEVSRFHGVELTSIINLIDLEGAEGRPLDSGPRTFDSGPRPLDAAQRPNVTQPGIGVPSLASDLAPTAPRPAPFPQGRQPGPPPPMGMSPRPPMAHLATRGQAGARRASSSGRRKPSRIRPWMVIAVILILAGIVAFMVALSGPNVSVPSK
jgi:hypothetical protein